jgi:hypothetical protein
MKSERVVGFSILGVALLVVACSSSSSTNAATSAKKTCADLQKCCDTASEPTKSSCNAATAAKNDDLCASSYDKMCTTGGAGGTSDGGASDGGGSDDVSAQCAAVCASIAKPSCTSTPAGCQSTCVTEFSNAKTKNCVNEWNATARCGSTATYTCGTDGVPTTDACQTESSAYAACTTQ